MTIIVIVAIIGSIPTILKAYKNPESEDKITWLFWSLGAIFNLFAIKSWTYEISFYPIQAAVILSLIFLLIIKNFK
jgi:glucose uptake protein GlcU